MPLTITNRLGASAQNDRAVVIHTLGPPLQGRWQNRGEPADCSRPIFRAAVL